MIYWFILFSLLRPHSLAGLSLCCVIRGKPFLFLIIKGRREEEKKKRKGKGTIGDRIGYDDEVIQ
jgi:hypothetical protein